MGCAQAKKHSRTAPLVDHHQDRNSLNTAILPSIFPEIPVTQPIRGPIKEFNTEPVTPVTFPNFRRQNGRLSSKYDTSFCEDTPCKTFNTDLSLSEALERSRRARALFFQPVEESFHKFQFTTPNSNNETIENASIDFSDDFQDENNNELDESNEQPCFCKETRQKKMLESVHSKQPSDELIAQIDHTSANVLNEPYTPLSQHSSEIILTNSNKSIKSNVQICSGSGVLSEQDGFDKDRLNIDIKVTPCVYQSVYNVSSEPILMNYKRFHNASVEFEIEQGTYNENKVSQQSFSQKKNNLQTYLHEFNCSEASSHMLKTANSCPEIARNYPSESLFETVSDLKKSTQSRDNLLESQMLQVQCENDSLQADLKSEHAEDSLSKENQLKSADVLDTLSTGEENVDSNIHDRRKSKVSFRADTNFEPKTVPLYQSDVSLISSDSYEIIKSEEKVKEELKKNSLISFKNSFFCCGKSKKLL